MLPDCERSNEKIVLLNVSWDGIYISPNWAIIHLHNTTDFHPTDVAMG